MSRNMGEPMPLPSESVPERATRMRPTIITARERARETRTPILSETPPKSSMAKVMPPVTPP